MELFFKKKSILKWNKVVFLKTTLKYKKKKLNHHFKIE